MNWPCAGRQPGRAGWYPSGSARTPSAGPPVADAPATGEGDVRCSSARTASTVAADGSHRGRSNAFARSRTCRSSGSNRPASGSTCSSTTSRTSERRSDSPKHAEPRPPRNHAPHPGHPGMWPGFKPASDADDIRRDLSGPPAVFYEQLRYLKEHGYQTITLTGPKSSPGQSRDQSAPQSQPRRFSFTPSVP